MEEQSLTHNVEEEANLPPSSVSTNKSPKTCNLSFSFNFDFDDVNTIDDSSDSETADLQIDVSEVDNYEPSNKHKRDTIEETSSVLYEMEEEIERQLDAKAAKTNLTVSNVKNILKHVITNEHVMAMVKNRLQDAEDDVFFEPKLTRAKAKELAAAQVNIPWPITPIKKSTSEVQALIEDELSEDSSDEEYKPEQDKQSDDEREVEAENSTNNDVDSLPPIPANNCDSISVEKFKSPPIQYDPEGIFKIPGIPHVPTEEESIGQRTRSKLCLSETPLEQIEQAFIPPDITTDMYDWDCEADEDWDNFLKEFTQPLTQEPVAEDDPEADPEYNILEDEETEFLDKEELRADKGVKVTRKELNNLIAELFEFTDTFSNEEQEISKKRKSPENLTSLENSTMICSAIDLLPTYNEPELSNVIDSKQRQLLAVQFRQHVQLMAQHFAMTYMHPDLHLYSETCKQNLNSIKFLCTGPNSAFNVLNLPHALKLVTDWENKFLDTKFAEDFKKCIADEDAIKKIYFSNRWKYLPKLHPELKQLFVESKALMFPQLLPETPFKKELNKSMRKPYFKSEENLVALGLEQFLPFMASKPKKFKGKKLNLIDAIQLIIEYLVPNRDPHGLLTHIQKRRRAKDANPIKHYFEKGCAPRTIHYITLECDLKAPKDQPIDLLPAEWQNYLNNTRQKIDLLKRKHILNSYNDLMKKDSIWSGRSYTSISTLQVLGRQYTNIFPKILPAPTNPKNLNKITVKNSSCMNENTNSANIKETSKNEIKVSSYNSDVSNKEQSHQNTSLKSVTIQEGGDKSMDNNIARDDTENDLHTNSPKHPKPSKKSSEVVQEIPQLRRTTPRLAKIKSAQNMKLMAQVLGPKGLSTNCNTSKSRDKNELDSNVEKMTALPKLDNEDEIAELMLASTTIKKDSISRKKAKEARELENIKRLLESENPLCEEERGSKFAASYLQKLHLTLESNSPETFRSVIKLYLDYYEKLDNINQMENELPFSNVSKSSQNEDIMEEAEINKDAIAINLYRDVCEKLHEYPELCIDFLLFLKPHQAAMMDKSVEYIMLQKMSEFINVAQIYFAKQPSRIAKMMQAITQLSSDPKTTLENVHTTMAPILKGYPLVMDLFLQILPTAKPPESLFAPYMFENLTCPVGPHDKNKIYTEDSPELYENVDLPTTASQEDPYGGENCRCNCHDGDEATCKSNSEHCVSCGTRFLNGRIYLQTSEGLRPAKIIFPGADEEKLENIARVSLKTTDKFVLTVPTKQRKKTSKNETNTEESYQKSCMLKNSPVKDGEEAGKIIVKSKRTMKSPVKSDDQKRNLKRSGSTENIDVNTKKIRTSQYKNRREKKADKKEIKLDYVESNIIDCAKSDESLCTNSKQIIEETTEKCSSETEFDISNDSINKTDSSDESKSTDNLNINTITKPWTRQEDMILLQAIKKEYSENSLILVSKTLGNRTVDQVRGRCETLLSLLEKMNEI